jgi:hypothetical protein
MKITCPRNNHRKVEHLLCSKHIPHRLSSPYGVSVTLSGGGRHRRKVKKLGGEEQGVGKKKRKKETSSRYELKKQQN